MDTSTSTIPKEIRDLKPINTRLKKVGDYYLVIKRTSVRINGKNIPKELGTIGYIKMVDSKYQYIEKRPKDINLKDFEITSLDYGYTRLIDLVCADLLAELEKVYPKNDALHIYVIAILRVAYSNVSRDALINYENDYLSIKYPGLKLSEKNLSKYYELLGSRFTLIIKFMQNRITNSSGKLISDGMLITNDSTTNTLSEYSRRGSKKIREDISLIYTYDFESKEPVASMNYPGNMLDYTAFDDFLSHFTLKNGLIVMDKGFYTKEVLAKLRAKTSYVIPVKRNDKRVKEHILGSKYDGILNIKNNDVYFKKVKLEDGLFLYAFKDIEIAKQEEKNYLKRHKNDEDIIDKLLENTKRYGLVVYESDQDLDPIIIYDSYDDRWEIELMFKYFQSLLDLDTVRVQNDNRLNGTMFINFISAIMLQRTKIHYKKTGLNEKYSYSQLKIFLNKLRVHRVNENDNNFKLNKTVKYLKELYLQLKVLPDEHIVE